MQIGCNSDNHAQNNHCEGRMLPHSNSQVP